MKILMVGFTNLARMPYANVYLEALAGMGHEIHLLYWKRDEAEGALNGLARACISRHSTC